MCGLASRVKRPLPKGAGQLKVYVFVGAYQGVIDTVEVHRSMRTAQKAFQKYTGIPYDNFQKALKRDPNLTPSAILGEKLDECKIFQKLVK